MKTICKCGNSEFEQEFEAYRGKYILDEKGELAVDYSPSAITRVPVSPWKCTKCGKDAPPTNTLPNAFEIGIPPPDRPTK